MPYHRFQVGQTVVAPSGVRDALIPPGRYVIIRLLPPVGDAPHYHVKSAADGHERALLEMQVRPVVATPASEPERAPRALVRQRGVVAKRTPAAKRTVAKPAPKKAVRRRR